VISTDHRVLVDEAPRAFVVDGMRILSAFVPLKVILTDPVKVNGKGNVGASGHSTQCHQSTVCLSLHIFHLDFRSLIVTFQIATTDVVFGKNLLQYSTFLLFHWFELAGLFASKSSHPAIPSGSVAHLPTVGLKC
jgi:hypothetical protein